MTFFEKPAYFVYFDMFFRVILIVQFLAALVINIVFLVHVVIFIIYNLFSRIRTQNIKFRDIKQICIN